MRPRLPSRPNPIQSACTTPSSGKGAREPGDQPATSGCEGTARWVLERVVTLHTGRRESGRRRPEGSRRRRARMGDEGGINRMNIIAWIVLGAIAGYLAGFLVRGDEGLGVIGHIVLGIIGAIVG